MNADGDPVDWLGLESLSAFICVHPRFHTPERSEAQDSRLLEEGFPAARRGEVVALAEGDADLRELARDVLGLDVLGDRLQPEAGADLLDRFHQRIVEVVLG